MTHYDVIERAARLLHALQWMGDQEDADAAWDRYPITSATRSDYLRTAEALAAAGLLTPSGERQALVSDLRTAEVASRGYRERVDLDWSEPNHIWLNAFKCIRPTDEFAAQVGHGVIKSAMQAHPKRATFTVNAS